MSCTGIHSVRSKYRRHGYKTQLFGTNTSLIEIGAGILIGILFLCPRHTQVPKTTRVSFDIANVKEAIHKAGDYLVRHTHADGMFTYYVSLDPKITPTKEYNILRHAATMYAISMYYQMYQDDNVPAALLRAGQYLRDECIEPLSEGSDMLAVWSRPEVTHSRRPLTAILGGAGLGLVALLSLEDVCPNTTSLSTLRALGRFIAYMQKPDGSFYTEYIPSKGGRDDSWSSLYYPGEATLGLVMLYEKDPCDVWLNVSSKALEFLAISRKSRLRVPPDHWALLATQRLLALKSVDLPVSRELLVNHGIQICEAILKRQVQNPMRSNYDGAFTSNGRTTPTATSLEGLLAALDFLPEDYPLRSRIEDAARRGIAFLVRTQIKEGDFAGAFPGAVGHRRLMSRLFNRRASWVRIDYVQHALSAMIQYDHFIYKQNVGTDS